VPLPVGVEVDEVGLTDEPPQPARMRMLATSKLTTRLPSVLNLIKSLSFLLF
jgi:hypothetical protein